MMLVVGATGATGQLLVQELLDNGHEVKVIVRSPNKLPDAVRGHNRLSVIHASLLDLSDGELAHIGEGCTGIASCLGHNLSFKGIYGKPRRLVTDAMRRLSEAVKANQPDQPVRMVLMNTAGNSNRDLKEPISFGEKCVIGLLRLLLPPHPDNEQAADYLRTQIGQNHQHIEWAVVRPDSLLNEDQVSPYTLHASPIRSAIFNAGQTSRINVAHFMATLMTEDELWNSWQGQMPVIYNKTSSD